MSPFTLLPARLGLLLSLLLLLLAASPSRAQDVATTLGELRQRVEPGATVYITDSTGRQSRVSLVEIRDSALVVSIGAERREFAENDIRQIRQRVPDSVWNGALASPPCRGAECVAPSVGLGALFGGIGAGLDALLKDRRVIYAQAKASAVRVMVLPLLTKRAQGAAVVLRF
jgi:hypothetical protein